MRLSNKKIETIAIKVVFEFEKSKGRRPKDVRHKCLGYDVYSSGRLIEVKGINKTLGASGNWRFIQQKSIECLLKNDNFCIYIVDNISKGYKNTRIYILKRKDALKFIDIKPKVTYSLHIPANQREKFRRKDGWVQRNRR
jgi:hypothetical protein